MMDGVVGRYMGSIDEALKAFRKGIPVLIYDSGDREDEVDYVVYGGAVDTDIIYEMRTVAGGLICYAMGREAARALGIPFASDYLQKVEPLSKLVKMPRYGEPPAFSVWVNHISVVTGIRDIDRATTIRELHVVSKLVYEGDVEKAKQKFYEEFMAPGHVPILVERSLRVRRGHTELSLALARLAGVTPSAALVEMLVRGRQLTYEEALRVSREYGYPLVKGDDIVEEVVKRMGPPQLGARPP